MSKRTKKKAAKQERFVLRELETRRVLPEIYPSYDKAREVWDERGGFDSKPLLQILPAPVLKKAKAKAKKVAARGNDTNDQATRLATKDELHALDETLRLAMVKFHEQDLRVCQLELEQITSGQFRKLAARVSAIEQAIHAWHQPKPKESAKPDSIETSHDQLGQTEPLYDLHIETDHGRKAKFSGVTRHQAITEVALTARCSRDQVDCRSNRKGDGYDLYARFVNTGAGGWSINSATLTPATTQPAQQQPDKALDSSGPPLPNVSPLRDSIEANLLFDLKVMAFNGTVFIGGVTRHQAMAEVAKIAQCGLDQVQVRSNAKAGYDLYAPTGIHSATMTPATDQPEQAEQRYNLDWTNGGSHANVTKKEARAIVQNRGGGKAVIAPAKDGVFDIYTTKGGHVARLTPTPEPEDGGTCIVCSGRTLPFEHLKFVAVKNVPANLRSRCTGMAKAAFCPSCFTQIEIASFRALQDWPE